MSELSKRIGDLSEAKRQLLAQRLKRKEGEQPQQRQPAAIARRKETGGPPPLSFVQERMWLLDQLNPDSSLYCSPEAVRLRGPLDLAALERSINWTVARHETLRSGFATVQGQPQLSISQQLTVPLNVTDLTSLPEEEREAEARRLMSEETRKPFDLSRAPLLRVHLLRLGEEHHIAVINMHHIIADGWSMLIFIREMATIYEALVAGRAPALAELPIQYSDFAAWQRERLAGELLGKQLDYWREQLAEIPVLQLPTDNYRPKNLGNRGARVYLTLSGEMSEALKALGQSEGATLFMTLLAAFQTLLYRYTGQEDIAVGSPIAGRDRSETEGLIGCFINTLVLRTQLAGEPSFRELLARTRETILEAHQHQDVPFERLVEELQPERDPSRTPFFQVWFHLNNTLTRALKFSDLTLDILDIESGTAKFDVTVDALEMEDGIFLSFEYNSELFEPATIEQMAVHYEQILRGVLENPERKINALPLLTEAERRRLLVEWNHSKASAAAAESLHAAFEAQAERTPDAVAVVAGEQQLTYRQLDERANQLARHLQSLGTGAETLVGVFLERSLESLVALLGTLKAGAAYLPLDPVHPEERLAFMLEDAQVPVILTESSLLTLLPIYAAASEVVCMDTDWKLIAGESAERVSASVTGDNLAYMIYTSGSTGQPKGVLVSHGAALAHMEAVNEQFRIGPQSRVLQFAPLNFDVSIEQIFTALLNGAALYLRERETYGAREFFTRVERSGLTNINLPPAYWHQLVKELADDSALPISERLKLIILGGDVLLPESIRLWQQSAPHPVRLLNAYGPTETVITPMLFELPEKLREEAMLGTIPIGRPVGPRPIYILDERGEPVPRGVAGELHFGGALLARGYFKRPELTAEKFIPDAFGLEPGARLYRTGDLARYLPDGTVEFLGRVDQQVKVRGFRIEPGEIEAVLAQHPSVVACAVIVREDSPGDKRLVAYVCPREEQTVKVSDLRAHVRERLPDYMTPAAFVIMPELPLTASGKLDRRALPAPDAQRPELERVYVPPGTETERSLVSIWAEVLELERVGVNDNFFELGGDSILCIQIAARAREIGLSLAPKDLFQYQTIAELAQVVTEIREEAAEAAEEAAAEAETVNFPSARLEQRELDSILAQLNRNPSQGN